MVTGKHTGESASIEELNELRNNLDFPVFIGSGLTLDNVQDYYPICDAMIIGSHFKENGFWKNALCYERVSKFMERVKTL